MDCSRLLENSYEAFYWLGLIASDGSIDKIGRIKLTSKDQIMIEGFKNFLGIDNKINVYKDKYYSVAKVDRDTVAVLKERYNINRNKTYEPVAMTFPSREHFLSYLIGFIDGDGAIQVIKGRKNAAINIKIHSSWLNELTSYSEILSSGLKGPKINKQGYAYWNICDLQTIKELKGFSKKLPCLERKWSRIDLKQTNKQLTRLNRSKYLKAKILEELKQGLEVKEVAKKLNVSYSRVVWYAS